MCLVIYSCCGVLRHAHPPLVAERLANLTEQRLHLTVLEQLAGRALRQTQDGSGRALSASKPRHACNGIPTELAFLGYSLEKRHGMRYRCMTSGQHDSL
jgi:hypothetical protein